MRLNLLISLFICVPATAQTLIASKQKPPFSLQLQLGMSTVDAPEEDLSGPEIGVGGALPFGTKWSMAFGARQGFDSQVQGLYSALGAGVLYSPWGEFGAAGVNYLYDGRVAASTQNLGTPRFLIGAHARQYFFNGSENVVPFTGVAIDLSVPVARLWGIPFRGHLDYAYMRNGDVNASVMSLGLGLEI